jgi:hypothetical protein
LYNAEDAAEQAPAPAPASVSGTSAEASLQAHTKQSW